MEVKVLGPLTVHRDGERLEFGGPREQAVLACLVIHAGEVVRTETLIRGVWSVDEQPEIPVDAVRTSVRRLRAVLEPDRPRGAPSLQLRTAQGGYLLDLACERVDSHQFDEMLGRARTALAEDQPDRAVKLAQESLSLWHGPAYAGLAASPAVAAEAARLEGQKLLAVETRLEADLALGHHAESVAELDSLARQHATHERFAVLLMIALYRSDRQANALEAYRAARSRLRELHGVEPGPELQLTHSRVLAQDPVLDPPQQKGKDSQQTAGMAAEAPPTGHERKRSSRRPWFAVGLGAAGLAAIAAGLWGNRGTPAPPPTADGYTVYHEFDLEVWPGVQYDLDVPPGQDVVGTMRIPFDAPEYKRLDLYRTVEGPDQFSGVDITGREDYNPVQVVSPSATAATCRQLVGARGGRARLAGLEVGSRVCLVTSEGKPTLLTVLELPVRREGSLPMRVIVAAR